MRVFGGTFCFSHLLDLKQKIQLVKKAASLMLQSYSWALSQDLNILLYSDAKITFNW